MEIAKTPEVPYYAVIFTSLRTSADDGYDEMADRMLELAQLQPGYLGVESARNVLGITVSYWKSEAAIRAWKADVSHKLAQKLGQENWYSAYKIRVCKVERDYDFYQGNNSK